MRARVRATSFSSNLARVGAASSFHDWLTADLRSSSLISGFTFRTFLRANAEKKLNAVCARRGLVLPS